MMTNAFWVGWGTSNGPPGISRSPPEPSAYETHLKSEDLICVTSLCISWIAPRWFLQGITPWGSPTGIGRSPKGEDPTAKPTCMYFRAFFWYDGYGGRVIKAVCSIFQSLSACARTADAQYGSRQVVTQYRTLGPVSVGTATRFLEQSIHGIY